MDSSSNASESVHARLKNWFQDRKTEKQLIDRVVASVEPGIENARGYRKKLKRPIDVCLEHCKSMVAAIPGPIYLQNSKDLDPLISAAFVGNEKIEDLLQNQELTLIPDISGESDRFALLSMTHRETTIFGSRQEGEMIVADARLTAITFAEHKIVGLSTSLESARNKLETLCFEIILEAISEEIAAKRTDLGELREHQKRLRAMSKMFSGGNNPKNFFGHGNYEDRKKLEKVEQMLIENEAELARTLKGNETPEDWLDVLVNYLLQPEKIFTIHNVAVRVDWRNVLVSDSEKEAKTITFAKCELSEDMFRDVVLISYAKGK